MLEPILNSITQLLGTQEIKVIKTNLPEMLKSTFSRTNILNKTLHENTKINHIKKFKLSTHSFPGQKIEVIERRCIENGQTYRIFNYDVLCSFSEYLVKFINLHFQIRSHANMYFTNKNQQSLGSHRDRYSVLVLQLVGSKKWNIEKKTITTLPGDIFYLPVGLEHSAISIEDSYHLSFSLTLPSIFELIDQYAYSKNLKLDFNNTRFSGHIVQAKKIIDEFLYNPEEVVIRGIKANTHNRELGRFGSISYHKDEESIKLSEIYTVNFDHIIGFTQKESYIQVHNSIESIIIKKESFKAIMYELFYLSQKSLVEVLVKHNELNWKGIKFIKFLHEKHLIKRFYLNS